MSVPTASSLKKMNPTGLQKTIAATKSLKSRTDFRARPMTKAQRELLGYGHDSSSLQNNDIDGDSDSNRGLSRERILHAILNDDELISHLQQMDFFVKSDDNYPVSSNIDDSRYRKQQHHLNSSTSNYNHHQGQHLGQPVWSSFVKQEDCLRKDWTNRDNKTNNNNSNNGASNGGFRSHRSLNNVDNNDFNDNDVNDNLNGNSSPVAVRMQQGVPRLNRTSDQQRPQTKGPGRTIAGANQGSMSNLIEETVLVLPGLSHQ